MNGAPGLSWLDLALWIDAVYRASWPVTQSSLLRPLRVRLALVPFLGSLVHCVVCTSAWACLALLALVPRTMLLSPALRAAGLADGAVLVAFSLATAWAVARALGDAD